MSQTIGAIVGQMQQGRSDAALLTDFVVSQDAEAFKQLVERHAGLVWSVCKRIIHRHQSAEDAFQATFVVLMQKAPRLRLHGQLSSWLYGVAVKIARRTQARDARLHSEKGQVAEATISEQQIELTVRELMEVVQEEVQRLPRRYQPVLELCLFNQMPVREAAERLQVSVGIVRGCLERGRKQLQARLLRRGIAPLALSTLSLTAMNAHSVSVDLVAVVKGMVVQEVPTRLMELTAVSVSGFRPVVAKLALVLLMITGVGLGMAKLFAFTKPEVVVPEVSVLHPAKPLEMIQGFVNDHQSNPVPHAKVEVYRDRKLEQEILADGVGRFEIPQTWKQQSGVGRTLLVRRGNVALGWFALSPQNVLQHDLHVTVLPLQAEIRGTLRNEQEGIVAKLNSFNFFISHPVNGWINCIDLPSGVSLLPVSTDAQGQFTVKLPIRTSGGIDVRSDHCVNRRIPYVSNGPGFCDLGRVQLRQSGIIQGVVHDSQGKPVAGAIVFAQQNTKDRAQEHFVSGSWGEAISDAQGRYVLDGLEPRAKFNVMLKEVYWGSATGVPLVLRATEGVVLSKEKPAELNLTLEPGRKIEGIVIDAKSKEPLMNVGLQCYGSARPNSSACVMATTSDQKGVFVFWVPLGDATISCNDGKHQAGTSLEVHEKEQPPSIVLKAEKQENTLGGYQILEDLQLGLDQAVIAEGDTKRSQPASYALQEIKFQTEKKLPAIAHWRLYPQDKVPQSTVSFYRMAASLRGNSVGILIPQQDQSYSLEVDLEGFDVQIQSVIATDNQKPVTIKLSPATYIPFQVQVSDPQGKQSSQARVQVELKRLGTTVDAPWGPVLITDEQGKGRIDHLRVGDTYRLRAWGQDGSTGVTDWKKISDHSEKVIEMKLAPTARR